ncbi:MAG: hypothetical protein H6740_21115 [Alphaproteobacteria bacterium]|nr:hypothetical protein [Alphaproteobacteria bacterium]
MPGPWDQFLKAFKSKHQQDIDRVSQTISDLEEQCEIYQSIIDATDPKSPPDAVAEAVRSLTNQYKIIRGVKNSLQGYELAKLVEAREEYDKQTLEELTEGPLLTVGGELQTAKDNLQTANNTVDTKVEDLGNAEEALETWLKEYPDLKLLLEAVEEATSQLDEADRQLGLADEAVVDAQKALKLADEKMIALAKGTGDYSKATEVVEAFTQATTTLTTVRNTQATKAQTQRDKKQALVDAKDALDKAIQNKLKQTSTPETVDKDNKLLALYVALKAAELALAKAREAADDAQDKVGQKQLELDRITDRATLLTKRTAVLKKAQTMGTTLRKEPWVSHTPWTESASVLLGLVGKTKFDDMVKQSRDVMFALEELIKLGMSQDELKDFYIEAGWPEPWWPPRLRAQEANWVAVKGLIADEDLEESQKKAKKQSEALATLEFVVDNQDTVLENLADGLDTLGLMEEKNAENLDKWLTLISSIVVLGKEGIKAAQAASSSDHESVDPVEQMMIIDDTVQAIGKTCSGFISTAQSAIDKSGATQLAALVPGLGALNSFGNMCANAMMATNTWVAAAADAEVHQKALQQQHRAEQATDFVQRRGKHLTARKAADAASDLIAFCGHICDLSGVAAPVGVALSVTSSAVSVVKSVSVFVVDTNQAQEAKELLTKARAGNPQAREDIFRYHGRYACALIAILAEEGDPIALSIYNNHNITKEMVVKSSAKVLKKYLMREMETENEPSTWDDWKKWFSEIGTSIGGFFTKAGNAIKDVAQTVAPYFKSSPSDPELAQTDLALAKMNTDSVRFVKSAVRELLDARAEYDRKYKEYEAMPNGTTQEKADKRKAKDAIDQLGLKLTGFAEAVTGCETKAKKALKDAAEAMVRMDAPRSKQGPTTSVKEKIGDGSKRRFKELIDEQRRVLTLLAQTR